MAYITHEQIITDMTEEQKKKRRERARKRRLAKSMEAAEAQSRVTSDIQTISLKEITEMEFDTADGFKQVCYKLKVGDCVTTRGVFLKIEDGKPDRRSLEILREAAAEDGFIGFCEHDGIS